MFTLEDFRTGKYGIPFSCGDELPRCCSSCIYLVYEESTVCFSESSFYYYCGYSWPDKLTLTVPPCLKGAQ